MADNVVLNQPTSTGASIATEDVAGVQHQKVIIETSSADGEATPINAINPLPVTGTFYQATQPISGTVSVSSLPAGLATSALQQTDALTDTELRATPVSISGTVTANTGLSQPLTDTQLRLTPVPVSGTFFQATQPVSATDLDIRNLVFATDKVDASGTVLGAGTNNIGDVDVLTLPAVTIAAAQTLANVTTLGTITNTVPTKEVRSSTPSQTSPSVTNASTSILASNASRLGATIYNEGAAICYMKLGATASVTSYTIQIAVGAYYEVPFAYTGAIDGITSAGTAQLRVTELT